MAPGTEVRPLSGSFSVPDNEILARPPSDSDLVLDDEVLARSGKPILLDVNGGPSQGLCHELLLVEFMIYRRFSRLHAQVLLQQHDKAKQTATHASHKWLNKKTKDMFSEFNLFISRLESLRRAPPPGGQSIREYLDHGPPVFMNYFEIQDSRWASYESMVEKLLRDPETAYWLDGPLDPEWCESAEEQLRHKSDRKSPEKTTWLFKMKRKFYRMAVGCLLLFWISHITAALAFALIARTSTSKNNLSLEALPGPKVNSGPEFDFILIFLLTYWYFSAVAIVVQGFLAKGFVYARTVFLGGVLACFGGFYILYILMGVSAASFFIALPTLFTVVLLLIRTM